MLAFAGYFMYLSKCNTIFEKAEFPFKGKRVCCVAITWHIFFSLFKCSLYGSFQVQQKKVWIMIVESCLEL